jgi:hypothetical protein
MTRRLLLELLERVGITAALAAAAVLAKAWRTHSSVVLVSHAGGRIHLVVNGPLFTAAWVAALAAVGQLVLGLLATTVGDPNSPSFTVPAPALPADLPAAIADVRLVAQDLVAAVPSAQLLLGVSKAATALDATLHELAAAGAAPASPAAPHGP